MSQAIFGTINPATTSGTQLATLLTDFKEAMVSSNSGVTRPTELDAGGYWMDTSQEGSPNFRWSYKLWTGTVDITVFTVNLAVGTISITGTTNTFDIARITADTVGPILKLVKERVANNGQVLDGDTVGEVQFVGADISNGNPIVARIRVIATDDMTTSVTGSYMAFETVSDATNALVENMRLVNGNLGIGTSTPVSVVHAVGATGIRSQNRADSTAPGKVSAKKSRILSNGQVLNNDFVGEYEFVSTSDAGADVIGASIRAQATETHTNTAVGTRIAFRTVANGAASLTDRLVIGSNIDAGSTPVLANDLTSNAAKLDVESLKLNSQDIASAATIAALSTSKPAVFVTGSTATIVQGLDATGINKTLFIHNKTTVAVTLAHQNVSATATNRLILPDSRDIVLQPNTSIELIYDSTDTRWRLKSGSGSGGGGAAVFTLQSIAAAGTITVNDVDQIQFRRVQSTGGVVDLSVTPFGSTVPKDGAQIIVVGDSDANSVIITNNDAAKGCVGAFSTLEFTRYKSAIFIYSLTLDRYVLLGGI